MMAERRRPSAFAPGHFPLQGFLHVAPVKQTGERVAHGLGVQGVLAASG